MRGRAQAARAVARPRQKELPGIVEIQRQIAVLHVIKCLQHHGHDAARSRRQPVLDRRTGDAEHARGFGIIHRRTFEAHAPADKGAGPHLAIQVKCVSWLARSGKGYRLVKSFDEKVERLHASPLYWYIFAHLSMPILEFTDPLFLVGSERVHCCADPQPKGEVIAFTFEASVQPTSRDQWHDCKVAPLDLAARVLELLRKVQGAQGLAPIQMPVPAGGIMVGLRG